MNIHKYIGTINYSEIDNNFGTVQWQPKTFYNSPLQIVTPSPMFLGAVGSAGTSLPTISPYGQEYVGALNMLRQDCEFGKTVFDLDRYIIKPSDNYCIVFKEPPDNQHHLNKNSEIINYLDLGLQLYIRKTLRS